MAKISKKKLDTSDFEIQNSLGYIKNINFISPSRYGQRFEIEEQIELCLNENLLGDPDSSKLPVLIYIMDVYFRYRIDALKLGAKGIESAECCSIILKILDIKVFELQKEELKKMLTKPNLSRKRNIDHFRLSNIWEKNSEGSTKEYHQAIKILLDTRIYKDSLLVTKINGQLVWNKITGWTLYMAGFIQVCMKKKWIKSSYSSTELSKIMGNTFFNKPNAKEFKGLANSLLDEKYTKPFSIIPENM